MATDIEPPSADALNNIHFSGALAHGGVLKMDGSAAVGAHRGRTLLLCYPHCASAVACGKSTDWAPLALAAFRGNVVAHVGDLRYLKTDGAHGEGGTTSKAFQKTLARNWTCVLTVPLPSWPLQEDALTLWERNKPIASDAGAAPPQPCAPGCDCAACAAERAAGQLCGRGACGKRFSGAAGPLLKCACRTGVAYCCKECSSADWKRHKAACRAAMAAAEAAVDTEDAGLKEE